MRGTTVEGGGMRKEGGGGGGRCEEGKEERELLWPTRENDTFS